MVYVRILRLLNTSSLVLGRKLLDTLTTQSAELVRHLLKSDVPKLAEEAALLQELLHLAPAVADPADVVDRRGGLLIFTESVRAAPTQQPVSPAGPLTGPAATAARPVELPEDVDLLDLHDLSGVRVSPPASNGGPADVGTGVGVAPPMQAPEIPKHFHMSCGDAEDENQDLEKMYSCVLPEATLAARQPETLADFVSDAMRQMKGQ
ncbi:unnamed protein product [Effrenium voratum]|nr:unnamed protein product [Effrenium voratum]